MNETNPSKQTDPVIINSPAERSGERLEVSADVLNEAVMQLRRLSGIRQREAERQERALAQLHSSIKRQARLNRFVIVASILVVVSAALSGYIAWRSAQAEIATATALANMEVQTGENSRMVKTDLASARESQAELARQVAAQMEAIRVERDQVRTEIRSALDEKTRMMATREAAIQAEKAALEETRNRIRQEQQALIQQTIQQLNAMSAELQDIPADDSIGASPEVVTIEPEPSAPTGTEAVTGTPQ